MQRPRESHRQKGPSISASATQNAVSPIQLVDQLVCDIEASLRNITRQAGTSAAATASENAKLTGYPAVALNLAGPGSLYESLLVPDVLLPLGGQ